MTLAAVLATGSRVHLRSGELRQVPTVPLLRLDWLSLSRVRDPEGAASAFQRESDGGVWSEPADGAVFAVCSVLVHVEDCARSSRMRLAHGFRSVWLDLGAICPGDIVLDLAQYPRVSVLMACAVGHQGRVTLRNVLAYS